MEAASIFTLLQVHHRVEQGAHLEAVRAGNAFGIAVQGGEQTTSYSPKRLHDSRSFAKNQQAGRSVHLWPVYDRTE